MKGIAERLKEARVARGLSIEDLAVATRINVNFLRKIESGEELPLPGIYRRTFIRSCARELGLDPDELLEAEMSADTPPKETVRDAEISLEPPVERSVVSPVVKNPFAERSQVRTMVIVLILLVTALVLSVKWLGSDDPGEIRENSAQGPPVGRRPDLSAFTSKTSPGGEGAPASTDSLTLRATTTESVWVQIVLDNVKNVEYMLPPDYAITLKARENFLLTVGNPAGLRISLNGQPLDILGNSHKALKDILLSRKLLPD